MLSRVFGSGIWQDFIAPFVFLASLFKSNLNIYEAHNDGSWYDLGYLLGLACFFGGSGKQAAQNLPADQMSDRETPTCGQGERGLPPRTRHSATAEDIEHQVTCRT